MCCAKLRSPADSGSGRTKHTTASSRAKQKRPPSCNLLLYSALLKEAQGEEPEFMYVVPPSQNFAAEEYRFAEYAAYYRYVKDRLEKACDHGAVNETYPEPCVHCEICRWFSECDAVRRGDDHLSLVAGIRRQQRTQLEAWDTATMAKLAVMAIPLKAKTAARLARRNGTSARAGARAGGGAHRKEMRA